jgi:hypothetical protein
MIDLYCERTGPGFWAEPFNALTSLAYLLAAWAVWRAHRRPGRRIDRVLGALLAAIGMGSALFHLLATPWARLLDEAPILVFQLTFLWAYGRGIVNLARGPVAGLLVAFLAAVLWGRQSPGVLNGSIPYLPALLVAVVLGVYHARTQPVERTTLIAGVACVTAALLCRIVDLEACDALPIGTHFLWHVLTAAALYLFVRGLLANLSPGRSPAGRPR